MRRLLRRVIAWLPWNRPSLADLPKDERRRIRALMWGATHHINAAAINECIASIPKNRDDAEDAS
jgi:hypothetical protein